MLTRASSCKPHTRGGNGGQGFMMNQGRLDGRNGVGGAHTRYHARDLGFPLGQFQVKAPMLWLTQSDHSEGQERGDSTIRVYHKGWGCR